MAAGDCADVLVTNGCAQFRFRTGKERMLPELAVGLCSEAFSVQIRAFSTGSDGLAEISDDDILQIILPNTMTDDIRNNVAAHLDAVLSGEARFVKFAATIIQQTDFPVPPNRKSHCALV